MISPPFAHDDAIIRIGRGLFDRTLPKPEWTHAAHFAAAIWVLMARPDLIATRDLPTAIRSYNEATGVANTDTGGYHETITLASIAAAAFWVRGACGRGLADACNGLLATPFGRSDWLLAYWSPATLFSVRARRAWLPPDRETLPF